MYFYAKDLFSKCNRVLSLLWCLHLSLASLTAPLLFLWLVSLFLLAFKLEVSVSSRLCPQLFSFYVFSLGEFFYSHGFKYLSERPPSLQLHLSFLRVHLIIFPTAEKTWTHIPSLLSHSFSPLPKVSHANSWSSFLLLISFTPKPMQALCSPLCFTFP